MVADETFWGVPYEELLVEAVIWLETEEEHIGTRKQRYGTKDVDLAPEWATEAALDPMALVGPGSNPKTVRVVGWSPSAPDGAGGQGRVLVVTLTPASFGDGVWRGVTAWTANAAMHAKYHGEEL